MEAKVKISEWITNESDRNIPGVAQTSTESSQQVDDPQRGVRGGGKKWSRALREISKRSLRIHLEAKKESPESQGLPVAPRDLELEGANLQQQAQVYR